MTNLVVRLFGITMLCLPTFAFSEQSSAFPGRVEAINRVEVSARVEGVVTAIHFQPGQQVEEGELLFSIDNTEFAQRVRAAEAVAQRAAAVLEDAQQEYDRNQSLKERGTISDSRYFKSKVAVSIASAAVAEMKSKLEAAQFDLEHTNIQAPISGIVSPPLVSRGSFVETGRKGVLATIVQLDPVRIAYDIPYPDRLVELEISDLTTIDSYADTIDLRVELAPGWTHSELAEPTHLSADVSPETRSITAWAMVKNPTHTLRPGMEVRVIPLGKETENPEKADVE